MNKYILDSNVIIALLSDMPGIYHELIDVELTSANISVVSYLEVMIGYIKQGMAIEDLGKYMEKFNVIPLDKDLALQSIEYSSSFKKKLKLKDLAIASTAKKLEKTLVTFDRDFCSIPDLDVKFLQL